jgi:hypothetical protein
MLVAEKRTADPVAAGPAVIEEQTREGSFSAAGTVAHAPDRVHEGGLNAAMLAFALGVAASAEVPPSSSDENEPAIEDDEQPRRVRGDGLPNETHLLALHYAVRYERAAGHLDPPEAIERHIIDDYALAHGWDGIVCAAIDQFDLASGADVLASGPHWRLAFRGALLVCEDEVLSNLERVEQYYPEGTCAEAEAAIGIRDELRRRSRAEIARDLEHRGPVEEWVRAYSAMALLAQFTNGHEPTLRAVAIAILSELALVRSGLRR